MNFSLRTSQKIMVAMSGGVDSTVAALVLQKQGYEVVGATLKIWDEAECTKDASRSCCSLRDIEDARACAEKLHIRHYVLNAVDIFRTQVIDYFLKEYSCGRTPNPCIVCNEKIKFAYLLDKANALGFDGLATGHYARIIEDSEGCHHLCTGIDASKDQSYALFSLSQETMAKVYFPLGDYTKQQVRELARTAGLRVSEKKDSQELCFIRDHDTAGYLARHLPQMTKPGPLVDEQGKKRGEHRGICFYTIGQRNRLGAFGKPMYVTRIDAKTNTIEIGEREQLFKKVLIAEQVHWTNPSFKSLKEFPAEVKIRYAHPKTKALVRSKDDQTLEIVFDQPQSAITPGQAAVVYKEDEVICGGWIR